MFEFTPLRNKPKGLLNKEVEEQRSFPSPQREREVYIANELSDEARRAVKDEALQ